MASNCGQNIQKKKREKKMVSKCGRNIQRFTLMYESSLVLKTKFFEFQLPYFIVFFFEILAVSLVFMYQENQFLKHFKKSVRDKTLRATNKKSVKDVIY